VTRARGSLEVELKRRVLLGGGLVLLATFFAGTLIAFLTLPKENRLFASTISGAFGIVLSTLYVVPRLSKSLEERIWAYTGLSIGSPLLVSLSLLFQFNESHLTEPMFFSFSFMVIIPSSSTLGFLIYEILSDHYGRFGGFRIKRLGERVVLALFIVGFYALIYDFAYALLALTISSKYIVIIDLLVAPLTLGIAVGKVHKVREFLGRLEQGNW
jgi:hypothetical protein